MEARGWCCWWLRKSEKIFHRAALSAAVTTCSQVCMPCSHRSQCWFQDDWLAGLKSLFFTSLRADYGHNVNTGFWRVHTSVTAPYLWPEAGEVKGQPLSSQWAWLNLHRPSRNCPASVDGRKSEVQQTWTSATADILLADMHNRSKIIHLSLCSKYSSWKMKTMTLLGFDTARSLSVCTSIANMIKAWYKCMEEAIA